MAPGGPDHSGWQDAANLLLAVSSFGSFRPIPAIAEHAGGATTDGGGGSGTLASEVAEELGPRLMAPALLRADARWGPKRGAAR